MNNNNNINNQNNNQEIDSRKKYETKYNIYHDKKDLDKSGRIVFGIIIVILVLIILAFGLK